MLKTVAANVLRLSFIVASVIGSPSNLSLVDSCCFENDGIDVSSTELGSNFKITFKKRNKKPLMLADVPNPFLGQKKRPQDCRLAHVGYRPRHEFMKYRAQNKAKFHATPTLLIVGKEKCALIPTGGRRYFNHKLEEHMAGRPHVYNPRKPFNVDDLDESDFMDLDELKNPKGENVRWNKRVDDSAISAESKERHKNAESKERHKNAKSEPKKSSNRLSFRSTQSIEPTETSRLTEALSEKKVSSLGSVAVLNTMIQEKTEDSGKLEAKVVDVMIDPTKPLVRVAIPAEYKPWYEYRDEELYRVLRDALKLEDVWLFKDIKFMRDFLRMYQDGMKTEEYDDPHSAAKIQEVIDIWTDDQMKEHQEKINKLLPQKLIEQQQIRQRLFDRNNAGEA